jgi:diadenylate cyclase
MTFFIWNYIKPAIEIATLWIVFYRILVFFEGTRAFQVLKGLTILLFFFLIAQVLALDILNYLLTKLFALSIIGLMIIFQQELRQGLARLGQHHLFSFGLEDSELAAVIDELTTAVFKMSREKTGALIAIERETKLTAYIESGISIDSRLSSEIIQCVFNSQSPIHDGGVIIRGDRMVAAACLFPLSDNPNFSKIIGTRHRAALGITEQTDALVLVVSEETGEISVASDGRFIPVVNKERLFNIIKAILVPEKKNRSADRKEKHEAQRSSDA